MPLSTPRRLQKNANAGAAHRHAPRHEAATAKRLGGRLTSGSGNQSEKGDVRIRGVLRVELKCTTAKSFSVTREMLHKIEAVAAATGEVPAMEVQFIDAKGTVLDTVAVVPTWVLDRLAGK